MNWKTPTDNNHEFSSPAREINNAGLLQSVPQNLSILNSIQEYYVCTFPKALKFVIVITMVIIIPLVTTLITVT
jgi:hypothetical protein